jgi:hypothetical protein
LATADLVETAVVVTCSFSSNDDDVDEDDEDDDEDLSDALKNSNSFVFETFEVIRDRQTFTPFARRAARSRNKDLVMHGSQ